MEELKYRELDGRLAALNRSILTALNWEHSGSRQKKLGGGKMVFCAVPQEQETGILELVQQAAEEIKEYVTQIWNDNAAREEMLEKLQDELNVNIRKIAEEREKLAKLAAELEKLCVKDKNLTETVKLAYNEMEKAEKELKEVLEVYVEAKEKGWKILFYPKLAHKVLKYDMTDKASTLIDARKNYESIYVSEKTAQIETRKQRDSVSNAMKASITVIENTNKVVEQQKKKLGEIKVLIVRGSKAYIYYSLLGQKICEKGSIVEIKERICDNVEDIVIEKEELKKLLALWKQNKTDSEMVYLILEGMFDISRTECFGKSIGDLFDDSAFARRHSDRVVGVRIRSGYIVDAIQAIYESDASNLLYGGTGGTEHIILFEEGDELQGIRGHYNVPFMIPSGDAIGELYFITKNGKEYGPYGDSMKRGRAFKLELPEDAVFRGFCGRVSDNRFVTELGLLYCKQEFACNCEGIE